MFIPEDTLGISVSEEAVCFIFPDETQTSAGNKNTRAGDVAQK